MSDASASREIVRPTLHYFGLTTVNLEAMLDWYGKVLPFGCSGVASDCRRLRLCVS